MAGLALVQEARDAGLTVLVDRGELIIRGPRRLADLARRLIDHKAAVLVALRQRRAKPAAKHKTNCGTTITRRLIDNGYPPIVPTIPPVAILATPAVLCPCCGLHQCCRNCGD